MDNVGNCQLNCASASTVRMRLSEAQARDSREAPPGPRASIDSPGTVWYDDGTNKYHEMNGWPVYDPDNPAIRQCRSASLSGNPIRCRYFGAAHLSA